MSPLLVHSGEVKLDPPPPPPWWYRPMRHLRDDHEVVLGDVYADYDGAVTGHGVLIRWCWPGFLRRWAGRLLPGYGPTSVWTGREDISDVLMASLLITPIFGQIPLVNSFEGTTLTWTPDRLNPEDPVTQETPPA